MKLKWMKDIFDDGQKIRHDFNNDSWIGTYNKEKDRIIKDEKEYESPSGFGAAHLKFCGSDNKSCGGWVRCLV